MTWGGKTVPVDSINIEYSSNASSPNWSSGNYSFTPSVTGTATFTMDYPVNPIIKLAMCAACDKETEYVYVIGSMALCPVCMEAVKKVRSQLFIDEIVEAMA